MELRYRKRSVNEVMTIIDREREKHDRGDLYVISIMGTKKDWLQLLDIDVYIPGIFTVASSSIFAFCKREFLSTIDVSPDDPDPRVIGALDHTSNL